MFLFSFECLVKMVNKMSNGRVLNTYRVYNTLNNCQLYYEWMEAEQHEIILWLKRNIFRSNILHFLQQKILLNFRNTTLLRILSQ